ncbi:MAG: GIY-YIG nuclease family protein [Ignavibacteria bacterium]|nr:GIY-YIG nuclease family protein [Ignavibacteria bacterium]
MKRGWCYILRCADGSYYTGVTSNPERRMSQHHSGYYRGYTLLRRPLELVWIQEFPSISQAIRAERQIKGWSRKKKEALMRGDFESLHELAQSKEMRERRSRRKGWV